MPYIYTHIYIHTHIYIYASVDLEVQVSYIRSSSNAHGSHFYYINFSVPACINGLVFCKLAVDRERDLDFV
jgi:hypothetical protein